MSDQAALTYSSYLALDEVLGAQRARTGEHDQLLFIVIHQVYSAQTLHTLSGCSRSSRPSSRRSTCSRR
jgi:tryptophan 2,3-dioxygenase